MGAEIQPLLKCVEQFKTHTRKCCTLVKPGWVCNVHLYFFFCNRNFQGKSTDSYYVQEPAEVYFNNYSGRGKTKLRHIWARMTDVIGTSQKINTKQLFYIRSLNPGVGKNQE